MFFPLKDRNPTTRTAFITVALIAINVVVFLYELMLGRDLPGFIASFGAIPYELTHFTDLVGRYQGSPIVHTEGPPVIHLTLFTSMFMHGGFMHLIGNMLYLWIFGNNIEDILGPIKFLFFYIVCGLAASVAHVALHPNAVVPTIGASGAVAGVLGAYLIAYPRARVVCLVFLVFIIQLIELPAAVVLVFWFVIQFFQGFASIASGATGGVAWFAHIGGFVAGLVLIGAMAGPRLRALREARQGEDRWRRGF
jgi:membrane associated rhomboid family serine protease